MVQLRMYHRSLSFAVYFGVGCASGSACLVQYLMDLLCFPLVCVSCFALFRGRRWRRFFCPPC